MTLSRELRIGNIVECDCLDIPREGMRGVRIDGKCYTYITGYGIHLVEEGKLEFRPIPLTEEWLLRFGFTRLGKDWRMGNVIVHTRKVGFVINRSTPIMRYVHQFQNYFFAAKGQELELKQ